MNFTFGIITAGGADFLIRKCIQAIREENIPNYEIIIVGNSAAFGDDIRVIEFDESIKPAWITRKKNIIASEAKYENIVLMHDYVVIQPGWYEGFLKFGNDFHICVNRITSKSGQRYRDFTLFKSLGHTDYRIETLLPYDFIPSNIFSKLLYISGTYYIIKKNIAIQFPLNEMLSWGMGEDVIVCHQLSDAGYSISFNKYSEVRLLKDKPDQNNLGRIIDKNILTEIDTPLNKELILHIFNIQKNFQIEWLKQDFGITIDN